jgi:hypothetical protein
VSWVELDQAMKPSACEPVLSDAVFNARRADIQRALGGPAIPPEASQGAAGTHQP